MSPFPGISRRSWLLPAVLTLATTPVFSDPAHTESRHDPSSARSLSISPAVWAEWSTHVDPSGAAVLDYVLLLRGQAGFFMHGMSVYHRGPVASVTINASGHALVETCPGPSESRLSFGRHTVTMRFDPTNLTLTVNDEVVSLQAVNVVLVDGVDSADGIRIENVFWVDPKLSPLETSVIDVVRREPAIFPFLRCEARVAHAATRRMLDEFCSRMAPE